MPEEVEHEEQNVKIFSAFLEEIILLGRNILAHVPHHQYFLLEQRSFPPGVAL